MVYHEAEDLWVGNCCCSALEGSSQLPIHAWPLPLQVLRSVLAATSMRHSKGRNRVHRHKFGGRVAGGEQIGPQASMDLEGKRQSVPLAGHTVLYPVIARTDPYFVGAYAAPDCCHLAVRFEPRYVHSLTLACPDPILLS